MILGLEAPRRRVPVFVKHTAKVLFKTSFRFSYNVLTSSLPRVTQLMHPGTITHMVIDIRIDIGKRKKLMRTKTLGTTFGK